MESGERQVTGRSAAAIGSYRQQPAATETLTWLPVCALFLLLFFACPVIGQLAAPSPAPIPETEIAALQDELAQGVNGTSSVEIRRVCKGVIRKAEALLQASPQAPNRYAVLTIQFQGQKRLFGLEVTAENRAAIFATCEKLRQAPDDYAEIRFEADMLLSERSLALADATVADRVKALEEMLARYRRTPAEWKSLMMASLIAPKLLAFDLENQIQDVMHERFGGDHEAIAYRSNQSSVSRLDAVFSGTYTSASGASMTFPYDRMGHDCLVIFWSGKAAGVGAFLETVKEQQERFPGRFEIYSFNVDELPDAGTSILQKAGLNCTAMHLPGGKTSSAYLAYAGGMDPVALLVNAQGHVCIQRGQPVPWPPPPRPPRPQPGQPAPPPDKGPGIGMWLDSERYLAQLQSLFIGDFLVADTTADFLPEESRRAIQAGFVQPPFRYRLSPAESLDNYRRAEALCRDAIVKNPDAPDLWVVRNQRIIALLGKWNLAKDPGSLEAAVKEAHTALAMNLPPGADVVSRFCLAKAARRDRKEDPEEILASFIEAAGGTEAPAAALAAAAILAVEFNAQTLYQKFRAGLLQGGNDDNPRLWPVLSFLRDRLHNYRLFWGPPGRHGHTREEKYEFRFMVSGVGESAGNGHRLEAELTKLDGTLLKIPDQTSGEILGIVFAEPPPDDTMRDSLVNYVNDLASRFSRQGVRVAVVVLSDDADAVGVFAKEGSGPFEATRLPGGLAHPLVRRLGILSADRDPNLLLLRPDGTIAWMISGLKFTVFGTDLRYASGIAIDINIEKVRSDAAFAALEKRDFKQALQLFEERLPPKMDTDYWTADRLQGRALAYMGLRDWEAALAGIEAALNRRKADFGSGSMCKCHGVVEMYLTKAMILEKLNRSQEADEQRRLAADERLPHAQCPPGLARSGVPVGVYYDWLKRLRLGLENE